MAETRAALLPRLRETRAARLAADQATADLLSAALVAARSAAAMLTDPALTADDLAHDLVAGYRAGLLPWPTMTVARNQARDRNRTDQARQAADTKSTGQAVNRVTRRRISRLANRSKARQVARLISADPCPVLTLPLTGLPWLTDDPADLVDLVRHQACLPGAWSTPAAPTRAGKIGQVLASQGPADLAKITLVGALFPAETHRGPSVRLAAVVSALLADGQVARVDPDPARWQTDRSVPLADPAETVAVTRFPTRTDPDSLPLTPADLARHQVSKQADSSPVRLVREASLFRLVDKRRLSARGASSEAAASQARADQPTADGVTWRAWWTLFLDWQAPADARGAAGVIGQAVDQAGTTVGRLVAEHCRQVDSAPVIRLSAALSAIGLPASSANRAALSDLAETAATRADRLAGARQPEWRDSVSLAGLPTLARPGLAAGPDLTLFAAFLGLLTLAGCQVPDRWTRASRPTLSAAPVRLADSGAWLARKPVDPAAPAGRPLVPLAGTETVSAPVWSCLLPLLVDPDQGRQDLASQRRPLTPVTWQDSDQDLTACRPLSWSEEWQARQQP